MLIKVTVATYAGGVLASNKANSRKVLTAVHHHSQSPDAPFSHSVLWLRDIVKEEIDCRSIVKCSFADDDCRGFLDIVVGTIEKLVQSAELQGVFYFLSDVLRLALGLFYDGSLLVLNKHASH